MRKLMLLVASLLISISMFFSLSINVSANNINGPDIIHKEKNQVFTINDLLNLYPDNVLIDNDEFTGYGNIPGKYIITIKQGAITKNVEIFVIDKWGDLTNSNDVLYVADKSDIYVSNERKLSLYEIIYYIYDKTGFVDTSYDFLYEENTNEYHSNFNDGEIEPSSYSLIFRLTYFTGNQETYNGTIKAIELPEIEGTILEPPPKTLDKIIKSAPLLIVFSLIVYFIVNRKKKRGYKYG